MTSPTLHTIDAQNETLGRIASRAAVLLRGKDSATFERHLAPAVKVKVVNASKLKMHNEKLSERYHKRYTGYPGGLRTETWATTAAKKGYAELVRKAVFGMIPGNKLRPIIMKNLTISE